MDSVNIVMNTAQLFQDIGILYYAIKRQKQADEVAQWNNKKLKLSDTSYNIYLPWTFDGLSVMYGYLNTTGGDGWYVIAGGETGYTYRWNIHGGYSSSAMYICPKGERLSLVGTGNSTITLYGRYILFE